MTSRTRNRTRIKNHLAKKPGAYPASVQVLLFNDTEWEELIEECCHLHGGGKTYAQVKRLGASGDGGRDVEARLIPELEANQWDLYQAKHYKDPVGPSTFFPELLKFFGHLVAKTYPAPRFYYLCSPKNAGPDLHNLLAAPEKFKERFLADLAAGKSGIKVPKGEAGPKLVAHVTTFDFSTIKEYLVRDLLELHASNQTLHFKRFHIAAVRGDDPIAPAMPGIEEQVYVSELVGVYCEHCQAPLTLKEIIEHDDYREHFQDCRNEFFCAEGLKRFSRDLMPGEFERLLDMVVIGVRSAVNSPKYKSSMDRLEAAINRANTLQVNDSPLHPRVRSGDLPGTCHHLVNDGRLKWLK
jgi:hypothetical protein